MEESRGDISQAPATVWILLYDLLNPLWTWRSIESITSTLGYIQALDPKISAKIYLHLARAMVKAHDI